MFYDNSSETVKEDPDFALISDGFSILRVSGLDLKFIISGIRHAKTESNEVKKF
jgi:hypothetical protein